MLPRFVALTASLTLKVSPLQPDTLPQIGSLENIRDGVFGFAEAAPSGARSQQYTQRWRQWGAAPKPKLAGAGAAPKAPAAGAGAPKAGVGAPNMTTKEGAARHKVRDSRPYARAACRACGRRPRAIL